MENPEDWTHIYCSDYMNCDWEETITIEEVQNEEGVPLSECCCDTPTKIEGSDICVMCHKKYKRGEPMQKEEKGDVSGVLYETKLSGMFEGEKMITYIDHEGEIKNATVLVEGKMPSPLIMTISEAISKASRESKTTPTQPEKEWKEIKQDIIDTLPLIADFEVVDCEENIEDIKNKLDKLISSLNEVVEAREKEILDGIEKIEKESIELEYDENTYNHGWNDSLEDIKKIINNVKE